MVLPPAYDRIESGEYIVAADTSQSELDRIRVEVAGGEALDTGAIPMEAPPPYSRNAESPNTVDGSSSDNQHRRNNRRRRRNNNTDSSPRASREAMNTPSGAINTAYESECNSASESS